MISKSALLEQVTELKNSKIAFLARLEASPTSFGILGAVSDIVRDGVVTRFIVGGDIMRVTIDAMGDRAILEPISRANQFKPVVIDLANKTPEVDFTPETAAQAYATYKLFAEGPAPTGAQLAAGLNRHVK
jgi:hypothetical protein